MHNEFINSHIKIGLLIHTIMSNSTVFSISLNIIENNFLLFPTFTDKNFQVVEWFEKKQQSVEFIELDFKSLLLTSHKMNFQKFHNYFLKEIPLIKNLSFLNYLCSIMKKDIEGNFEFNFNKSSLKSDLESFWGKPVYANLLKQKLDIQLVDMGLDDKVQKI